MKKLLSVPNAWMIVVPFAFYVVGMLSNKVAIIANGGSMPVLWSWTHGEWDQDATHSIMQANTHLKALCDIFVWSDGSVSSLGDFLLEIGEYLQAPLGFAWLGALYEKHVRHSHQSGS